MNFFNEGGSFMNIMTDSQVSQTTVNASIQRVGEYGHWFKVTINVKVPFDINNAHSSRVYYNAWQRYHNLPVDSPFHKEIEMVKNEIRLHEMMLSSCRGITYVSFLGDTHSNKSEIQNLLEYIFCNNITFKD